MKKTLLRIVTACLFFIFLTAYSSNPFRGTVGNVAPNFKVENDLTTVELQKLKGKYVLFLSSGESRGALRQCQYKIAGKKKAWAFALFATRPIKIADKKLLSALRRVF